MLMRYYWKGLRWLATAACGVICATTLAEAPADSPVEPTAEVTEVAEDSDSAQPEVAEKTDATAETNSADPAEAGKADANPEAAKADSQNADETEANSEFPGAPKLDKALQKRLAMKTAIELDEVIGLVASAIGEGLPPDDEAFAKELLSNSLYQRAEIKLQPILAQINPQDQEIDHTLFAENEDLESALGDLDSVVELNPKMIQAWVRIATLRLAQGGDENHAKAIKAIDTAVENSRNEPLTCVGALLLRSSMREDAESKLADLDEALKVLPNHAPALRTRALVYIEQKDYEKALADLNAAIERDPTHLPTVQARAALLMLMERPAEAIASLDAVIESGDVEDTSPLRFEKAKLLAQEEEYAEAVKVLNRIILENPSALDAYLLRATVYQQMKKYEDALADIDRLMMVAPRVMELIRLKIMVMVAAERYDDAKEYAELVLGSRRNEPEVRLVFASLDVSIEDYEAAIEELDALLLMSPDNPAALLTRANAYSGMGKQAEAKADYAKALEQMPEDSLVLNNYAWLLATSPQDELRDGAKAVEMALKACELTKYEEPYILSTLAAAYAETGNFDKAMEFSKKACEANKDESKNDTYANELKTYEAGKPFREAKMPSVRQKNKTDAPVTEEIEAIESGETKKPGEATESDEAAESGEAAKPAELPAEAVETTEANTPETDEDNVDSTEIEDSLEDELQDVKPSETPESETETPEIDGILDQTI